MRGCLLTAALALIIVGRAFTVFYAGSPVPFNDQWYAEAQTIVIPQAHGWLHLGNWFLPNNEHVVLVTKLLSFLLITVQDSWDCIAQMLVNCALSAVPYGFVIWTALTRWGRVSAAWATVAVAGICASPLFYGNVVWGFQSQILVMCGTSTALLYLLSRRGDSWKAALAGVCLGMISVLSFASGIIAPAIAAAAGGVAIVTRRRHHVASTIWLVGSLATLLLAWWVLPHRGLAIIPTVSAVAHTAVHAFGFPARFYSYWGFVVWSPAAIGLVVTICTQGRSRIGFPLYLAAWVFLQILSISIGRSTPAIVLAPRYYDILMLGVLANLLLLVQLLRSVHSTARWFLQVLLVAWCAIVGSNAFSFARSHTSGDLPVLKRIAEEQVLLFQRFYSDELSAQELAATPMPQRPLADPAYLGQALHEPVVKRLLPGELKSGARPVDLLALHWPSCGPQRIWWVQWSRALALAIALGMTCYALVVTAGALRRSRVAPTGASPAL